MRRSAVGIAVSSAATTASSSSTFARTPKTSHSVSTSARVVVSSNATPTICDGVRADVALAELAQVDALRPRRGEHRRRVDTGHRERVEERAVDLQAAALQPFGEDRGQPVNALRDTGQAVRSVIDGVHARHHGEQHLRGADVGRRLLAADVLLARLQRQPVRRLALRIDRHADQPAGHRALERVLAAHERGVRAAEAERHAEPLRVADDDVGAPRARRFEQRERQQVGRDAEQRARCRAPARRTAACRGSGRSSTGTGRARRSSRRPASGRERSRP